jgi:hypothetical protein
MVTPERHYVAFYVQDPSFYSIQVNFGHKLSIRYDMLPGTFRRYGMESRMSKFIGIMSRLFIDSTLQTGRSRFRFPVVSLEFFSDIILPVALWPWGRLSL